jgi:hypothetical protein
MEQARNNWWEVVMVKKARKNNIKKIGNKKKRKEGGEKNKEGEGEKNTFEEVKERNQ